MIIVKEIIINAIKSRDITITFIEIIEIIVSLISALSRRLILL